jgi:hypothetical protein
LTRPSRRDFIGKIIPLFTSTTQLKSDDPDGREDIIAPQLLRKTPGDEDAAANIPTDAFAMLSIEGNFPPKIMSGI